MLRTYKWGDGGGRRRTAADGGGRRLSLDGAIYRAPYSANKLIKDQQMLVCFLKDNQQNVNNKLSTDVCLFVLSAPIEFCVVQARQDNAKDHSLSAEE